MDDDKITAESVSSQTDLVGYEIISETVMGPQTRTVATQVDLPLPLKELIKLPGIQKMIKEHKAKLERQRLEAAATPQTPEVSLEASTSSTLKESQKTQGAGAVKQNLSEVQTPSTTTERQENQDVVQSELPEEPAEVIDPSKIEESQETQGAVKQNLPEVQTPSTTRINHQDLICRTDSEEEIDPPGHWYERILPKSIIRLLKPKKRKKRKKRACRDRLEGASTSHHQCRIHRPARSKFFLPYTYTSDETESDEDKPNRKKPRKF